MTDKMRSEFEGWAVRQGFDMSRCAVEAYREFYYSDSTAFSWYVWQACAARMVPDEAVSILADVINALESGFVRCETCGDQEDTATLDCIDDLRRIHYMLSATPEGKK